VQRKWGIENKSLSGKREKLIYEKRKEEEWACQAGSGLMVFGKEPRPGKNQGEDREELSKRKSALKNKKGLKKLGERVARDHALKAGLNIWGGRSRAQRSVIKVGLLKGFVDITRYRQEPKKKA